MEEFEDLKRKLINKVGNREMPEEVIQIINNTYKQIMQIMQRNGVSNGTVEEVIVENNKILNRTVNNNISNARRDSQLEELNHILIGIQRNLEEIQTTELDDEEREEENNKATKRNITSFEEMNMNSRTDIDRIVDLLDENVREVRSVARRILSSRGVSENKIEDVYNEFSKVIYDIKGKVPEKLMQVLQREDAAIIREIIETYEDYEKYKSQKRNKTKHEQFADSLDAGISLEEQHKFSNEFCNRTTTEEAEGKDKTSNLLEDLFK